MAVTAARAANQQTIDSTGGACFNPTTQGRAAGIVIACHSTSSNSILVNVAGLHASGEFFEIEPGQGQAFRVGDTQLGAVTVKGAGGNALIGWAIFLQK